MSSHSYSEPSITITKVWLERVGALPASTGILQKASNPAHVFFAAEQAQGKIESDIG